MTGPALHRRLIPALAAAAGVAVAHAADYTLGFRGREARHAYLHATGHGYWPLAVAAATLAAVVAVVLVGASAGRRAARGANAADRAPAGFGRLAAWQLALFVALEVVERGWAGSSATELLHSRELWLGLALQVPVAWLAAQVLHGVERTAAAVGARLRRPGFRPRRMGPLRPAAVAVPSGLSLALPARPRAPPA